ncbi:MAG: hypothetical protein KF914_11855 [Rhizobiaceae bacterium]|nr:hypothetical protein [Rhizobiaceae bacterium]
MAASGDPAKWEALRALRCEAPATYARLAAAGGVAEITVRRRAKAENWPALRRIADRGVSATVVAPEPAPAAAALEDAATTCVAPIRRRRPTLAAAVAGQIEAILADAETGRLDKGRVDAVLSMIRMNDEAAKLRPQKTKKKTMRSDDQIADTMRRIDERIVELAVGLAERMGTKVDPG